LALCLAGRFLAGFLTALFGPQSSTATDGKPRLLWTLYRQCTRLVLAVALGGFLLATLSLLRVYLHQALAGFQRNHGRVTEANFNAIQTIWGTHQEQGELRFELYYEEEVTERIESEDLTKPAVLRKKTVRHNGFCRRLQEPGHVLLVSPGLVTALNPRLHLHLEFAGPDESAPELSRRLHDPDGHPTYSGQPRHPFDLPA